MHRTLGFPQQLKALSLFESDAGICVGSRHVQAKALVPLQKHVRLIEERFQDECLQIFGIAPGALTANEAGYLVDFRSADALRNRLSKARQEIDRRLRSKGISRSGGPAEAAQANAYTDTLNSTD